MGNNYRYTSTTVSLINYHFVFCPRYRRKIFLIPNIEKRFKELVKLKCKDCLLYTSKQVDAKVYSTYYTTRKDNAWAKANPDEVQQCYIMTGFYTAVEDTLKIPLMKGISKELMLSLIHI